MKSYSAAKSWSKLYKMVRMPGIPWVGEYNGITDDFLLVLQIGQVCGCLVFFFIFILFLIEICVQTV